MIERGQRDGSIASTARSATLADVLMSMMSGIRVASRTDSSRDRLAAICGLTLSILDRP
jgi:TetR/AcrR family transcriptional regulator, transcriptional repressor for nem operon